MPAHDSRSSLIGVWRPTPVITAPPPGIVVTGFRDPCVWKDEEHWYMGHGSGFPKIGGAVLLYRSRDLRSWKYVHPPIVGKWNGKVTLDLWIPERCGNAPTSSS
jgi:sucrose-6-phosphate hydrolase SacC (GH32 family)